MREWFFLPVTVGESVMTANLNRGCGEPRDRMEALERPVDRSTTMQTVLDDGSWSLARPATHRVNESARVPDCGSIIEYASFDASFIGCRLWPVDAVCSSIPIEHIIVGCILKFDTTDNDGIAGTHIGLSERFGHSECA